VLGFALAQADVFEPEAWQGVLDGAVGVVSTLGAFGSNDFMYKVLLLLLSRLCFDSGF
jgi:hypothetical protein